MVVARINDKVASAVEGNKDLVAAFTKELTTIVSQATINGLKKETDYWVLRRFYNASGEVEGNFYTALILYSVPRSILDDVIKEAIKQANLKTLPKTPEEEDVRSTVIKAFNSGI